MVLMLVKVIGTIRRRYKKYYKLKPLIFLGKKQLFFEKLFRKTISKINENVQSTQASQMRIVTFNKVSG